MTWLLHDVPLVELVPQHDVPRVELVPQHDVPRVELAALRVVQHDALAAQPDVLRVKDNIWLCPVTIARLFLPCGKGFTEALVR